MVANVIILSNISDFILAETLYESQCSHAAHVLPVGSVLFAAAGIEDSR